MECEKNRLTTGRISYRSYPHIPHAKSETADRLPPGDGGGGYNRRRGSVGTNRCRHMSSTTYFFIVTALFFVFIVALRAVYVKSNVLDWLFIQVSLGDNSFLWLSSPIPFIIYYFDTFAEKRFSVFGIICTLMLPIMLLFMNYMLARVPVLAIIALAVMAALVVLACVVMLLPQERPRKKKRSFLSGLCILYSFTKRTICIVSVIFSIFFGIYCLFTANSDPKKEEPFAGDVAACCEIAAADGSYFETYRAQLTYLNPDSWGALTLEKKLEIMQCITNIEMTSNGVTEPVRVMYAELDEGTVAQYSDSEKLITVDTEHLAKDSYYDCLLTILHECRHAYQHEVVRAFLNTDPKYRNLSYYNSASQWADSMADYPALTENSTDEEYLEYLFCSIEVDSETYAYDTIGSYLKYIFTACAEDGYAKISDVKVVNEKNVQFVFFGYELYIMENMEYHSSPRVLYSISIRPGLDDIDRTADSLWLGFLNDDPFTDFTIIAAEQEVRSFVYDDSYDEFNEITE